MIESIESLLSAAGSSQPRRDLLFLLLFSVMATALAQELFAVLGFSIAVLVGSLALFYELVSIRSKARQRKINESWPIVIDSLESAAVAGMSLVESIRDLGESEQLFVAREFSETCRAIDSGVNFNEALLITKRRLANPAADFTLELLRLTNLLGSAGYISALRNQAVMMRHDESLRSELEAKQGWVVGTAKMAVTAPWLIVAILCLRQENAVLYQSATGTLILVLGLIASVVALRMVYRIGAISFQSRVFA
jgi:tight adherence protein B